jgi:epoxyqueuosine reductase QueG
LTDKEEFRTKLKGSLIKQATRRDLRSNVAAAISVRDDEVATAALERARNDPESLVREAATCHWSGFEIEIEKQR